MSHRKEQPKLISLINNIESEINDCLNAKDLDSLSKLINKDKETTLKKLDSDYRSKDFAQEYILEYGLQSSYSMEPDGLGTTALMGAVMNQYEQVVEALIRNSNDISFINVFDSKLKFPKLGPRNALSYALDPKHYNKEITTSLLNWYMGKDLLIDKFITETLLNAKKYKHHEELKEIFASKGFLNENIRKQIGDLVINEPSLINEEEAAIPNKVEDLKEKVVAQVEVPVNKPQVKEVTPKVEIPDNTPAEADINILDIPLNDINSLKKIKDKADKVVIEIRNFLHKEDIKNAWHIFNKNIIMSDAPQAISFNSLYKDYLSVIYYVLLHTSYEGANKRGQQELFINALMNFGVKHSFKEKDDEKMPYKIEYVLNPENTVHISDLIEFLGQIPKTHDLD